MNFRLTIVLTIILLAAATAFFVIPKKEANKPGDNLATSLLSPKPSEITTIDFTRYGEQLKFVKQGDQWKITAPLNAAADASQLNAIAAALQNIGYAQKFEPESSGNRTPEATGTANPHYRVTFADAAGRQYTLSFGKHGADGIYATLNADKTIYILNTNPLEQLDQDIDKFRNNQVKQIDTAKVTGLALQSHDQSWKLNKSGEKWLISAPIAARGNATAVGDVLKELQQVRAQSFSTLSKKDTGLEPALITITAQVQDLPPPPSPPTTAPSTAASQPAGTPVVLQLGYPTDLTLDKKDSPVYASFADSNEVFILANASVKKLIPELKDLRDPAVTPAPVADATAFSITTDGAPTAAVTKKENAWTLTSTATPLVADPFAISDYLAVIRDLRAIKFVDNAGDLKSIGLDPPHMKIELTLPSQSQHEVLLVGTPETADKVTPVMRQGEPTVYLLQTAEAEKLVTSNLALRDKEIESLLVDKIRKIEIAGPAATSGLPAPASAPSTGPATASVPATMASTPAQPPGVTLERDGAHWQVKKDNASLPTDEPKITSLLADFTPLTASKYLDEKPLAGAPSVTVTLSLLEPTAPPIPPAATSPATSTAPSTAPTLADVLPKTGAIGPDPGKIVIHTLRLYKDEANNVTTWKATWDNQTPPWTFQPTPSMVEHLTKEAYATAATQPASQPATKP